MNPRRIRLAGARNCVFGLRVGTVAASNCFLIIHLSRSPRAGAELSRSNQIFIHDSGQ